MLSQSKVGTKGKRKCKPRAKSKTRRSVKDLECFHFGKQGHLCNIFRLFRKENENEKKGKKKAEGESSGKKEEVNTIR